MTHLHVHSCFSLCDSTIRIEELVATTKENNQTAVAITDHGNIHASVTAYKALKSAGLKYIHGCEMYICDNVKVKDNKNRYCHLLVLCKDEVGRQNLNKLITLSNLPENSYYRPRIDFELLQKYSDGLVICSACLAGELPKSILNHSGNSIEIINKYKSVFGSDYYIEIQARNDTEQKEINRDLVELAKTTNTELVVTTDAHYNKQLDAKYQAAWVFNGELSEAEETYIDCYLQNEDDIRRNLAYLPNDVVSRAIANTDNIANHCNVDIPLSAPIIPEVKTPSEYGNNKEWLQSICAEGICRLGIDRYSTEIYQQYKERLEYEINALDKMGFIDYILLVHSYSNIVKRRGIARGSGGGSLVCYLSRITDIDPIEHGLYFERFIDVGALELIDSNQIQKHELKIPDIDLDFGTKDREKIIQYLSTTYGKEHVASIGRFSYNHTKGSIRDCCRALKIDDKSADNIAKLFENYELEDVLKLEHISKDDSSIRVPTGVQMCLEKINNNVKLFDYVKKLNGLPRSFGLHPCGKIVATRDLDFFTASCWHESGERYLQGDMHDVESIGLVKIDVLGLRTLDVIYDTLDMIGEDYEYINPKKLDYTDENILNIFREGNTEGVFQFSSYGMRNVLKNMNVSNIDDLSVANALYRPGAKEYIVNFCNRRRGTETPIYIHDDLRPILSNTYAIMVFQEQLIEVGRMVGMRNPDLLRKATAKKDEALLAKIKPELFGKLQDRGWTQPQCEQFWSDVVAFAKYSFNKSHSSAYAIIACMTAKLKAYHPKEFFAALYNSYIGEGTYMKQNVHSIFSNMCDNKIRFNKRSYRNNHLLSNVQNGKVNYAIPLIKDCGQSIAEQLSQTKNKKYLSFIDLLYDIESNGGVSKRLEILIKLDFFSEFGNSKYLLMLNELFIRFKFGGAKQIRKDKLANDEILDSIVSRHSRSTKKSYLDLDTKSILFEAEELLSTYDIPDFSIKEKTATQKEYLGYVDVQTGNPEDRQKLFILDVRPIKTKDKSRVWAYGLKTISIGTGKNGDMVVRAKEYNKEPVKQFDTIYVEPEWLNAETYNGYKNWYINQYQRIA